MKSAGNKETSCKDERPAGRRARRWLLQSLMTLCLGGGLLAAIILLGRWGLESLRGKVRYAVTIADVECQAPPGLSRAEFLEEVRYLAQMPERIDLLEAGLANQLTRAFAQHPWVDKVESLEVEPSRKIQARLSFRRPVLAVRTAEGL